MREQFRVALKKYEMVCPNDGIVLGISGGPDSMAMLALFQEIMMEMSLKLYVVHLNHGFRGAAAEADAAYVKAYCDAASLPCYLFERKIAEEAKCKHISFEEAGRMARYELFEKVRRETGSARIAVAHNQNDQAETVLMRLIRGTGVEGLAAIPPVRDRIIRPLIHISRQDIEAFGNEKGLQARVDHTNEEDLYHRNSIRLNLLPMIEQHYNPSVVQRLSVTADLMRDENEFMNQVVEQAMTAFEIRKDSENRILLERFTEYHVAVQRRLIREVIRSTGGTVHNLSYDQVEELLLLLKRGRHGNKKTLGTVEFEIIYDCVRIRKQVTSADLAISVEDAYEIHLDIIDKSEFRNEKSGINTLWMDFDQIKGELTLRTRREGDAFVPSGMTGSKSLKRFMVDEKIPKEVRDKIPLLCDDRGILWIYGYRASERCKVEKTTSRIAKIEIHRIRS